MWTCMLACHIWDVKTFGSVVRPLHLWNGVYQTLWQCTGISHAGWHSHWRKSTKFHSSDLVFFLHFYCISFMASPPLWSILKYLDSTMGINWYYVQTLMIHRGGIVLTLVIIPWLFLLKNGLWHWTISEIFLKNSVEKGRRFPKNTWQVIGRPICQSTSIMGELQPIRSTVGEQY